MQSFEPIGRDLPRRATVKRPGGKNKARTNPPFVYGRKWYGEKYWL